MQKLGKNPLRELQGFEYHYVSIQSETCLHFSLKVLDVHAGAAGVRNRARTLLHSRDWGVAIEMFRSGYFISFLKGLDIQKNVSGSCEGRNRWFNAAIKCLIDNQSVGILLT